MKAISLFSCGGIGDLALREQGVDVLVANELTPERAEVFKYNFPEVDMIVGDIWDLRDDIVQRALDRLGGSTLDIVFATPPCQGMSKNGRGKLLNLVRSGHRPKIDPRNELVIPAIDIFLELGASTLIMENVPEMDNTLISMPGEEELFSIPDYIGRRLGRDFRKSLKVVEFADYGVPQRRQRLITVFTKNENARRYIDRCGSIFPAETHSRHDKTKLPWVTVRKAISHLPPLDARNKDSATNHSIPLHKVPTLDKSKYFWVSNTPPGKTAFDNQCVNNGCEYEGNSTHSTGHNSQGINKASTKTPIECAKCGELLPRPWVEKDGEFRLMKGFTSAYKRMDYDLPSSALTRNLSYACSDNKLHPIQNRVLSIHEATILHSLDGYPYEWKRADGKRVSDKLVRELIGESIPPKGLSILFAHFLGVLDGRIESKEVERGGQLELV